MTASDEQIEAVREALREHEKNYVKSWELDVDVPKKRVGNALTILEDEGVVERWNNSKRPTWRVLV